MTTHEPFAEWAAVYAVGALDGDERRQLEAHLAAGCTSCERELRETREVLAALPLALPDAPLPPALRAALLERSSAAEAVAIETEEPAPSGPAVMMGEP